jgi:hypothetical protein
MRYLSLLIGFLIYSSAVISQSFSGFNYQGVLRDGSGELLENKSVTVKFVILSGSGASKIEYTETHVTQTDENGHFGLVVGQGSTSDNFSDVNWSADIHHLKVEIDQGSGFVVMGTTQLQTVPYAMVSQKAMTVENVSISMTDLTDVSATGAQTGQVLTWNGTEWAASNIPDNQIKYTAGSGLSLNGNEFEAKSSDAMWNANALNGATLNLSNLTNGDRLTYHNGGWINQPDRVMYSGNGIELSNDSIHAQSDQAIWNASSIHGIPVSSGTPTKDQVLSYNGNSWTFADQSSGSGGSSPWSKNGDELYYTTDNVGIGIDDPVTNLHVWDSVTHSNNGLFINSEHTMYSGSGSGARYVSLRGINFANNGLSTVGILGVATGTTASNGEAMGVWASATASTAYNTGVYARVDPGATAQSVGLTARVKGTSTFNVGVFATSDRTNSNTNYGVFAVGDSASTSYAGYFVGDVTYTGSLSQASDMKFKRDVQTIGDALGLVNQLRPTTYFYKNEGEAAKMNFSDSLQYGFIAQELEEVLPSLVTNQVQMLGEKTEESIEYKGVNYVALIPLLTKAIQEQQELIKDLEARIKKMEENDQN